MRIFKRHLRRLIAIILATAFAVSAVSLCFPLSASETDGTSPPLSSDSILRDYVDGDELDSAGYKARLIGLEDDNTYVFDNGDGTHTVYMMYEDLKYTDSSGKVREKDLSLVRKSGGYSIASSNIGLYMPDAPKNGINMSYAGRSLTITPLNIGDCDALTDRGAVVYPGAFGEGTFLRYTPLLSGIKEDVILSEYTERAQFTFLVESESLELFGNDDDGYYLAAAGVNSPAFRLGDVVVYDAVGKPDGGSMEIVTLAKGRYEITISANDEFLSDPDTVYPVTVDPTVTVSDKVQGASSIEDAPVFELQPNRNCGTYLYNSVGTTSASYGVGRTAVRLGGLLRLSEYQSVEASRITKVTFHAKDASGSGSQFINLYPLVGNTTWTESNVTWNNVGSYSVAKNYGASMRTGQWTTFDITDLVKAWKNGTYPAQAGFILINENETNNKCFYSSESASDDNKPYVKFTYEASLDISQGDISVNEGSTQTIRATIRPSGLNVTWTSADTSVATVDSTGKVTGVHAGTTTITATATDSAGITHTASCTLTVTIPNGVYHIKNLATNYYLHVRGSRIYDNTDVYQYTRASDTANVVFRIPQMWKITYFGGGFYTIRPLHKTEMGLDVTDSNVDIYSIGTADDGNIPTRARWTINRDSTGYVFKNNGSDRLAMQSDIGSKLTFPNIVVSRYTAVSECHWELSRVSDPPTGVYWYDTANNRAFTGTPTRYVAPGETRSLSDLNLIPIFFSATAYGQNFNWAVGETGTVTVGTTGGITGLTPGTVTVNGSIYSGGTLYNITYNAVATEIPINIEYLVKNKHNGYYAGVENGTMSDGTTIQQWGMNDEKAQRWIFTHVGDGYYTIKSTSSQTSYYLGVKNDSASSGADIVLRTGSITDGMKWKIEKLSSGSYKLTAKCSQSAGYVLSASTAEYTNGPKLTQYLYGSDEDYTDEWHITDVMTLGFSTDNSTGCSCKERQSYRYANKFYDEISNTPGNTFFSRVHHCNYGSTRTASKNDFAVNGAISNEIDFMIYMGHGWAAKSARGNNLHYSYAASGTRPSTNCADDAYNIYGSEMHFGSDLSKLRFVWLYTCNFLVTGPYVTDESLKNMLTGAHVVMGYETKATLCDAMALKFANNLRLGMPVYKAYFDAGINGEGSVETENHILKVLYISQAESETIYNPHFRYEYDSSDIIVKSRSIHS